MFLPFHMKSLKKYDIRRYGAHGTSHKYLSEEGLKYLPGVKHPRIISCHIGSGASITAIKDGKCVATSMGLTPLGGIMMCTRTGDMDPSVFNFVASVTGRSAEEVYQMFNKKSGFLGLCGYSDSQGCFSWVQTRVMKDAFLLTHYSFVVLLISSANISSV